MIDLHCHILPDMDDGPSTLEESISMVQIALKEGIDTIVATSHFTDFKGIDDYLARRDEKIDCLLGNLAEKGIKADIVKGAEVYIDMELFDIKGIERLTLNGSRYVLTELPMMVFPLYTEEFLYRLQLSGFVPIIAHPERNEGIIRKPELLYRLVDLGSLAQINTGSITGFFGQAVQKCAQKIIKRKMAHAIATDAHSDGRRMPAMSNCLKVLNNWIGQKEANKLANLTPAAIIANKDISDQDEPAYTVTQARAKTTID
ncbi:MAG: Tyrosine-protein phosphatase YwqE [Syntrophomonadaceae bacterium]|nr:Tyrosine-protein phosphatase YwqE [Bacillota bacterium]